MGEVMIHSGKCALHPNNWKLDMEDKPNQPRATTAAATPAAAAAAAAVIS